MSEQPSGWQVGEPARVVEYDEAAGQPKPDAPAYAAEVMALTALYIIVKYTPAVDGRERDQFWLESGWRAWDSKKRWRLVPVDQDGNKDRGLVMPRNKVSREQALADVRKFLDQWDEHYPPRLQIRRT